MRERISRDLDNVRCIKIEDQKVIVKDIDIKERWREYFSKLLNEDPIGGLRARENNTFAGHAFHRKISVIEVKKVLARMKVGKGYRAK